MVYEIEKEIIIQIISSNIAIYRKIIIVIIEKEKYEQIHIHHTPAIDEWFTG